jgi:acetyl-CoA C-acetyltransferase
LHKGRRIADLAAPVVAQVLADARLDGARVDEIILGNASEGGNPARLVALASGLPEAAGALTLDRQCASGLDAIITAVRTIAAGEANVVLAGGAESLSTAPWRVARPRSVTQLPQFTGFGPGAGTDEGETERFAAFDRLAAALGIGRAEQDAWALRSFEKALAARQAGRFVGEIVPLRHNAEETRDQSAIEASAEDLADLTPFAPPTGTATPGNTSALHDGAAMTVVVSEQIWQALGRPPALRLVASAVRGVSPAEEATAPAAVVETLFSLNPASKPAGIGAVELNERSAGEAIAFTRRLNFNPDIVNSDGGAIARGHAYGAAGAVLAVRLFTRMIRSPEPQPALGLAALGAFGGLGLAALFERA